MAGFALSPDEIASVCHTLAARADDVPEQVARIRSSEVGQSDLGGSRYADLYRLYHEMTQDTIPTVLTEHAAAGRAMADQLAGTLHAYQQTEADAAARLNG